MAGVRQSPGHPSDICAPYDAAMDFIGSPALRQAAESSLARSGSLAREVVARGLPGGTARDAALAKLAQNALFSQAMLAAIRSRLAEVKAAVRS